MTSLETIFNQFIKQSGKLFALPDIYQKLDQLLKAENTSIADIGFLISSDGALTAQVLKLANSPAFSFKAKITNIDRAINLIGTQELKNMVLMEVIVKNFNSQPCSIVNPEDFWRRSSYQAIIAKKLALHCQVSDADRLFVCGILSHIGKLICCYVDPDKVQKVNSQLSLLKENPAPAKQLDYEIEKKYLDFSYSQLSAKLLQFWKVPDSISLPIANFSSLASTEPLPEKNDILIDSLILQCASITSFLLELKEDEILEASDLLSKIPEQTKQVLKLDEEFLNDLLLDIEIDAMELLSAIFPESTSVY